MPAGPRYDDDFYAWTQYQAAVLREIPATDNSFDRQHVAEEIEDLGKASATPCAAKSAASSSTC